MRRLPIVVLFALAVSACGGSSDSSSKRTTSTVASGVSMQAYVTAGNNVCMAADRRIVKLGRLSRDPKGWARTAVAPATADGVIGPVTPPAARGH